jgi:hypothetical protein
VTRKRDSKPCLSPPVAREQDDEEQDLQKFCSGVHYEEMSFENWCHKHQKLDLEIPVFVSKKDLSAAFRIVVKLTRTIRTTSAQGHQEKREKIERELVLGPDTDCRKAIKLRGLGDVIDDQAGDLWIIIRIKD